MKIVLFEDNQCSILRPLGLFRPLFDHYCGSWTLFKLVNLLDQPVRAVIRDHFLITEDERPTLPSPLKEPHLFLNASIVPDVRYYATLKDIIGTGDPCIMKSRSRVTAAVVPPGSKIPAHVTADDIGGFLLDLELPSERLLFKTVNVPFEMVMSHVRMFDSNLEKRLSAGKFKEERPGVYLGRGAKLAQTVECDTEQGPVVIGDGAVIKPFTCLTGPVYIGRKTTVSGHSTIGNKTSVEYGCTVGGEITATEIEPNSSIKRSFIGHSSIGRWVSLGAGTTMSDEKSTFGTVRIVHQGNRIETGMRKLGSIIGSLTTTGVSTTLFSGKTVGVCSSVYGMAASNIPSFTSYAKSFGQVTELNPDQVTTTQERLYKNHGRKQSKRDTELINRIYTMTSDERKLRDKQITF